MGDQAGWWAAAAGAAGLGAAAWWLWGLGRAVAVERARELFRLQHERYEEALRAAAERTGKPRGLRWVGCEIVGAAVLARDPDARQILAFVPVTVRFEPVEGSDMEDVPAARDPRTATAVFAFRRGEWATDGRVVFNLGPRQAVAHLGGRLRILDHPPG